LHGTDPIADTSDARANRFSITFNKEACTSGSSTSNPMKSQKAARGIKAAAFTHLVSNHNKRIAIAIEEPRSKLRGIVDRKECCLFCIRSPTPPPQ
jgi:hypothetical protein